MSSAQWLNVQEGVGMGTVPELEGRDISCVIKSTIDHSISRQGMEVDNIDENQDG
jgi:hypothetical protein